MKDIEKIGRNIVHSAIKVHKALGPGLLESVYQKCLAYELEKTGLTVACEVPLPVKYYLKSAIAYLAAASRRRVCCRSKLLQTPCNTEDAVKGAIPKGTNFKNFFYFHTQQYGASQNIHSIC